MWRLSAPGGGVRTSNAFCSKKISLSLPLCPPIGKIWLSRMGRDLLSKAYSCVQDNGMTTLAEFNKQEMKDMLSRAKTMSTKQLQREVRNREHFPSAGRSPVPSKHRFVSPWDHRHETLQANAFVAEYCSASHAGVPAGFLIYTRCGVLSLHTSDVRTHREARASACLLCCVRTVFASNVHGVFFFQLMAAVLRSQLSFSCCHVAVMTKCNLL